MGNFSFDFSARYDGRTRTLDVAGTVRVMTGTAKVTIERAEPQGITSSILLLNLKVENDDGPMKPQPRLVKYSETGLAGDEYRQVQIISDWHQLSCLLEIERVD